MQLRSIHYEAGAQTANKALTRTTIDLCEDDDHMNSKADAKIQMVMRHVRWIVTTIHEDERIVRHTRGNTVDTVRGESRIRTTRTPQVATLTRCATYVVLRYFSCPARSISEITR